MINSYIAPVATIILNNYLHRMWKAKLADDLGVNSRNQKAYVVLNHLRGILLDVLVDPQPPF